MGVKDLSTETLSAFAGMAKALEKMYGAIEYITISTNTAMGNLYVHYVKIKRKEKYLRRYQRRGERMRKRGTH